MLSITEPDSEISISSTRYCVDHKLNSKHEDFFGKNTYFFLDSSARGGMPITILVPSAVSWGAHTTKGKFRAFSLFA